MESESPVTLWEPTTPAKKQNKQNSLQADYVRGIKKHAWEKVRDF
jgi:hypothetical protein